MAMMDDKKFLVSHIRNSFITSDDTGMCELIIENEGPIGEKPPITGASWPAPRYISAGSDSGLDSEGELASSYDIMLDMDFGGHRRRSNTAQRLERLKKEKHKQSKIKHVPWRNVDRDLLELSEFFEKKDYHLETEGCSRKSLLSQQLEQFAAIPNNPFSDYARFDGRSSSGIPTKKIEIFLTMASEKDRPYPMTVVTLTTAKVQDLIGLIGWQYTNENRQPSLCENIEALALHIAEDDGEVDTDFPALDNREPISKFGFAKLALVETEPPPCSPQTAITVTINMFSRGVSKISVDDDTILMKELLEKILERRKMISKVSAGLDYHLEKEYEPGVPVKEDKTLGEMGTLNFCLVRKNSIRGDVEVEEIPQSLSALAESLSSHQYRSYRVSFLHKFKTNTEVQLGISGEKIEIDPITQGKLFKQKAVTYGTEYICGCTLVEEKTGAKAIIRLVHASGHDYKHHDFECDIQTAKEIVQKINNILEMRASPTRKEYIAMRERRHSRRHLAYS